MLDARYHAVEREFGEYQTSPFSAICSFIRLQLAPSSRSACYLALLSGNIDLFTGSE